MPVSLFFYNAALVAYSAGMKRLSLISLAILLAFAPFSVFAQKKAEQGAQKKAEQDVIQANLALNEAGALAIVLRLAPGWRTYGRMPGASGIAPRFDFSGSDNARIGAVVYPPPQFFDDGVGGYYGYEDGVVFTAPMERDPALASHIRLRLEAGVCRDLCVPVNFDLTLDLTPR